MTEKTARKEAEKTTLPDMLHAASSIALSFIPGAGELFNACVMAPAERRRNDWIESIEKELYELNTQFSDITERVQNNEQAISVILTASPIALKTHNPVKLEALRNIVINAVLHEDYEEYKFQMFLSFIDDFTEWHIRLLEYFSDPQKAVKKYNANFDLSKQFHCLTMEPFKRIYPLMNNSNSYQYLKIIVNDLHSKGLLLCNSDIFSHSYMRNDLYKAGHPYTKRTTDFSDEFLKFIADYKEK